MARRKKRKSRRNRRWIQRAIKRPGRVKRYIMRVYGPKAFTKDGEVKHKYLLKAIRRAKRKGNKSLLRALYLARTFELMKKGK